MCTNRLRENTGFHTPNPHETEGKNIAFHPLLLRCSIACNTKFSVVLSYVALMQYTHWVMYIFQVPSKEGLRALVLCPTRELALQTTRELKKLTVGTKFRVRVMTKALASCNDFSKLPCDILVSTPLRLDALLKESKIDLSK